MRTVSEEEAAKCKANLERWSKEDVEFLNPPKGNGLGEWIYGDVRPYNSRNDVLHEWRPIPQHLEFGKSDEEQVELEEDPMSSFDESLTPMYYKRIENSYRIFFMSF